MTVEQKITEKNQRTLFESNRCKEMVWQDSLDSIIWAVVFIWAGLVVFLHINLGYSEEQGWSLFFLGAGVLVVIELAIRLLVPAHHRTYLARLFGPGSFLG